MTEETSQNTQHYAFEAEVNQVLGLVINSLYSNKEIFVRELISNASDAIDKARFRALAEKELLGADTEFHIRLEPDAEAGTLAISDNGIGMSREELIENLGTIAHSGSRAFLDSLKAAAEAKQDGGEDVSLIGQFGVGFYSAFLVADEVEVITRAAGSDEAWRWVSRAEQGYTIEPAERAERGTTILLHLKEELRDDYLGGWKLRQLVSRYADYVSHPIELPAEREEGDESSDQAWTQVNEASALWRRSTSEITDEQYNEFYKHLTHDWQEPLARTHFRIEGTQQFTGLLFVPGQPPFDMFSNEGRAGGVRLYVKRVFIMEDCKELLPQWLRFVRGVIDSDDLPLNVSRETLQDSRAVRVIERQVVKKTLALLEDIARDQPEDYARLWEMFGRVLKEGLHFAPEHADKLAPLMRYQSSHSGEERTGLTDYVERMPDDQPAIYYALGPSTKLLENSPHLEGLKKRGWEVLYMTDGVDEWAVHGLREFDGKPLISALSEELDLGEEEQDEAQSEERKEAMRPLTERIQSVLDTRVREVRVSTRLEDSPACLVIPQGGLHAHIERMLRANDQDVPATKRILEINPTHSLIKRLRSMSEGEGEGRLSEWIEMLYDQALISEGSPVEDPARFARRVTELMERATSAPQA